MDGSRLQFLNYEIYDASRLNSDIFSLREQSVEQCHFVQTRTNYTAISLYGVYEVGGVERRRNLTRLSWNDVHTVQYVRCNSLCTHCASLSSFPSYQPCTAPKGMAILDNRWTHWRSTHAKRLVKADEQKRYHVTKIRTPQSATRHRVLCSSFNHTCYRVSVYIASTPPTR